MKRIFLVFIAIGLFTLVGCQKDDDPTTAVDESKLPVVTTLPIDNFSYGNLSALLKGIIVSEGGSTVIARGFCWDSLPTVDTNSNKSSNGAGTGNFNHFIDNLEGGKSYYVRAYAINSYGIKYGDAVSFVTAYGILDADGNIYTSVKIGTQEWMTENLRTTKYADGTSIPNVTSNTAWSNLSTGAWSYYNNSSSNDATYGKLYNWYAVNTSKLCPTGWHVPTDAEWTVLTDYLTANGHNGTEGTALKATSGWDYDGNGTDDYGFLGLPGGHRSGNGVSDVGYNGYWWSSSQNDSNYAWSRYLGSYDVSVASYSLNKEYGFSVRCLRD